MNVADPEARRTYDELLHRLQSYGSELASGFTSHAPMVVEALYALNRGEAAGAWLDRYLRGATPSLEAMAPLPEQRWQESLGQAALEPAWFARFEADIATLGWEATLARWIERLAPGFAAAAAHGVIRTAHAARALTGADTPPRRAELAGALALWASTWQALPWDPQEHSGSLGAHAALARVPLVPAEGRRNNGAITTALAVLAGQPGFAASLGALDRRRPANQLALDLATAFADTFLDQVHSTGYAIVFTHALTGVTAARRLAPWAGSAGLASLLAQAWQTGAGLHACYSRPDPVRSQSNPPALDALVDAAVRHGDEHVIKLTEACVELHGATGDVRFPAVAARALEVIPAG